MKKTGSLILSLLLSVSLLLSGGVLRVEAQEADASLTQTTATEKKENGASEDSSAETPTEETDSAEKATEPSATIEGYPRVGAGGTLVLVIVYSDSR